MRTAGAYLRAEPEELRILDGRDDGQRTAPIGERLRQARSRRGLRMPPALRTLPALDAARGD